MDYGRIFGVESPLAIGVRLEESRRAFFAAAPVVSRRSGDAPPAPQVLVTAQEEMIQRIDDDVDQANLNLQHGQARRRESLGFARAGLVPPFLRSPGSRLNRAWQGRGFKFSHVSIVSSDAPGWGCPICLYRAPIEFHLSRSTR